MEVDQGDQKKASDFRDAFFGLSAALRNMQEAFREFSMLYQDEKLLTDLIVFPAQLEVSV